MLAQTQTEGGNLDKARLAWLQLLGDESSAEHWAHGALGRVLLELGQRQVCQ